jgi:hypothetical protein
MERLNVNLVGAVAASKPLEKNTYAVLTKKFKLMNVNEPGKYPGIFVEGEVCEGEFAGKQVSSYLTTNPEIIESNGQAKNFMLFRYLRAFDLEPKDKEEAENFDVVAAIEQTMNQQMLWTIDIDKRDPEQNNVTGFALQ